MRAIQVGDSHRNGSRNPAWDRVIKGYRRSLGFRFLAFNPIMETQVEDNMENEAEIGIYRG